MLPTQYLTEILHPIPYKVEEVIQQAFQISLLQN